MAFNVLSKGWRSSGISCLPTHGVVVQQDQHCHLFPAAAQGLSSSLLSKDEQEHLEASCPFGFALSLPVPDEQWWFFLMVAMPLAWNTVQKMIGRVCMSYKPYLISIIGDSCLSKASS